MNILPENIWVKAEIEIRKYGICDGRLHKCGVMLPNGSDYYEDANPKCDY